MCDDRRLLTSRWYDILYMIRKLNKGESGDYNGRKQGNTDRGNVCNVVRCARCRLTANVFRQICKVSRAKVGEMG